MNQGNDYGLYQNDINFIRKNNLCTPERLEDLETKKNNYTTPNICFDHRRIQEKLRNEHNYHSDQNSWNRNNKVLHNYDPWGFY